MIALKKLGRVGKRQGAMGAKTLKVAVGSKYGPRSRVWNVTCENHDVYISTSPGKLNRWKISMHESGRWHLKETGKTGERLVLKSHRDELKNGAYEVGVWIRIPESSLVPAADPDHSTKPDYWLDRPVHKGSVEIAILRWDVTGWGDHDWPGRKAGTRPIVAYTQPQTYGRFVICVMQRNLLPEHPLALEVEEQWQRVKREQADVIRKGGWFLTAGHSSDGAGFCITELNY
jgi:hypothetical protein